MATAKELSKPPLLAIPAEIRLQIYSTLLTISESKTQHIEMILDLFYIYPRWLPNISLKLPLVGAGMFLACKQLYVEFTSALYSYLDDDFRNHNNSRRPPGNSYCFRTAMTHLQTITCPPLVAPLLLRANTDCIVEQEGKESASSVTQSRKEYDSWSHSSNLSLTSIMISSQLRHVTVHDTSNLLPALTQPSNYCQAAGVPNGVHIDGKPHLRHIKVLQNCVHAFKEAGRRRRVPILRITKKETMPNRQIEIRFGIDTTEYGTGPKSKNDGHVQVQVYIFGIGAMWYKRAEMRVNEILALGGTADYHFKLDSLGPVEAKRSWERWKDTVYDYYASCSNQSAK